MSGIEYIVYLGGKRMAIVSGFLIIFLVFFLGGCGIQIFLSITKSSIPGLILPIISLLLGILLSVVLRTSAHLYGFLPYTENIGVPVIVNVVIFLPSIISFLIYGICRMFVGGRRHKEDEMEPWRRD